MYSFVWWQNPGVWHRLSGKISGGEADGPSLSCCLWQAQTAGRDATRSLVAGESP
jgi:hypothetical protein